MTTSSREYWVTVISASVLIFLVVAATSCCAVPRAFLEGEEAAYGVLAKEYVAYVNGDEALSEEQAEDRRRTIRAWRFSLDKAAKAIASD